MVRYVDETSASVWVETRICCPGFHPCRRQGLGSQHLRSPRSPLRAGGVGRTGARNGHALRRRGRRNAGLARSLVRVPAVNDRDTEDRKAAADGLRHVPDQRAARCNRQPDPRRRFAARLCPADGRGRWAAVAGSGGIPRRPGVRRLDQRADAGVHPRAGATSRRRPARSSRITRSTPTCITWPGQTPRTGGCCPPCPAP